VTIREGESDRSKRERDWKKAVQRPREENIREDIIIIIIIGNKRPRLTDLDE